LENLNIGKNGNLILEPRDKNQEARLLLKSRESGIWCLDWLVEASEFPVILKMWSFDPVPSEKTSLGLYFVYCMLKGWK